MNMAGTMASRSCGHDGMSPRGPLVEGLEEPGERFVLGVQCHPERTESSPEVLERVWQAFVEAAAR